MTVLKQIFDTEKDPIKYRLMGYIQTEKGECAEGAKNIQEFLNQAAKDRHLPSDYGMLGKALACIKDDAGKKMNDSLAIMNMEKAIDLGDTVTITLNDIAAIHKANKSWSKLATTLEKGIAKSKRPSAADYYTLADAYSRSKEYVKADSALSTSIVLYKETWWTPYLIKARVKQYANTTDTTFASAAAYEKYIAVAQTMMKDEDKAKESNKKNMSEAYGYLGYKALLLGKDPIKATELMNQALKFDPNNTKAQQVLQSITGGTPAPTGTGTTPPPNNNTPNGSGGTGGQPRN